MLVRTAPVFRARFQAGPPEGELPRLGRGRVIRVRRAPWSSGPDPGCDGDSTGASVLRKSGGSPAAAARPAEPLSRG
jgi:hypothetical protein